MAGSTLFRVTVTHDYGVQKFEQDLKKAVLAAGIDGKHTVFLLKDAQVRRRWEGRCLPAVVECRLRITACSVTYFCLFCVSRNGGALWSCRITFKACMGPPVSSISTPASAVLADYGRVNARGHQLLAW